MQTCPYCTLAGSSGWLLVWYKRNYYSSSMACKAFPCPHQARDSTLLIESNWNILQRPMKKGRYVSVIAWGCLRITKTFSRMRRSEIKGSQCIIRRRSSKSPPSLAHCKVSCLEYGWLKLVSSSRRRLCTPKYPGRKTALQCCSQFADTENIELSVSSSCTWLIVGVKRPCFGIPRTG